MKIGFILILVLSPLLVVADDLTQKTNAPKTPAPLYEPEVIDIVAEDIKRVYFRG